MKALFSAAFAFLAFAFLLSLASPDKGCTGTGAYLGGNWYCSVVPCLSYQGVGPTSSYVYPLIVNMNNETGECEKTPQAFSGKMAPLNEDLSVHLRGPLVLKQFAVYYPSAQSSKRHVNVQRGHQHGHQHAHGKFRKHVENHRRKSGEAKRAVGDLVTATMDGKVVSWINQYDGSAPCAVPVTATIDGSVISWTNGYCGPSTAESPPSTTLSAPQPVTVTATRTVTVVDFVDVELVSAPSQQQGPASSILYSVSSAPTPALSLLPGEVTGSGAWVRDAYYNTDDQSASGIMFLNNMGGTNQSGTWNSIWGSSLSYANEDSSLGSGEPQIFAGTLEKNYEISIFSDTECTEDICGYWRPGSVAYNGFAGSEKAFFFEFSMPDDGDNVQGYNMPAIWFLNGKVPRTQQYGNCSCWPPCGEFDAFEVLTPGFDKMKATLLGIINGGISDYFERPVNGTVKSAVIFINNNIVVQLLPDDFDFDTSLSLDQITALSDTSNGTNWPLS